MDAKIFWSFKKTETRFSTPKIKGRTIHDGTFEGRTIGGNLRCLLKLKAAGIWPNFKDSILFLESYKTKDMYISLFEVLNNGRAFKKINGIVIEFNYVCRY